jgi:circadian clock protein KaiB
MRISGASESGRQLYYLIFNIFYIYSMITTNTQTKRAITSHKAKDATIPEWDLRLYVAGTTLKSSIAIRNLERLCHEHLADNYQIEIVDLTKNPQLGVDDQIVALPTLLRKRPFPNRKLIGSLTDTERVLASLDLGKRS